MSDDPQPKSSSSTALWLALGALGLVMVLGVVAVFGFAFYQMRSARRSFQAVSYQMAVQSDMAAYEQRAGQLPDGTSSRECAEHFLRKLNAGEYTDAYQQFTTQKFRQGQTLNQFRQFLGDHPEVFGPVEFVEVKENGNAARYTLQVSREGEPKVKATLELSNEGSWKVDRFSVP